MKVSIVLGTRPEIIKMAPVVRQLEKKGLDFFILHTGQHYSYNMDKVFFEQLRLPQPKYNLEVGSGTHAEETGKMLVGMEKVIFISGSILDEEKMKLAFGFKPHFVFHLAAHFANQNSVDHPETAPW
jgi:nucleoside-diphosphate-sugar epimerase